MNQCEECKLNESKYILTNDNDNRKIKFCKVCFYNKYFIMFNNGWKNDNFEICKECNTIINCSKENIYIIRKNNDEIIWCKDCFEDLWKDAYNDGWRGDDIENENEIEINN